MSAWSDYYNSEYLRQREASERPRLSVREAPPPGSLKSSGALSSIEGPLEKIAQPFTRSK